MAEKHKTKYKAPKDLEKSQKPKPRKDLKDYTVEDKDEKLNPKSTGEKQKNVLRKTDKEVIDNGSLVPDLKDADRAYKPEGEHDPKHAAKVMSKRQDDDEKENKENIKDKIENLTREQKERLVREYIRRRIKNVLKEQEETPEEEVPTEEPVAEPAPAETPAPEAPAPEAPIEEPTEAPVEEPAPAPAPEAPAEETPEESGNTIEQRYIQYLETTTDTPKQLVSNLIKLGLKLSSQYDVKTMRNFFLQLKLTADRIYRDPEQFKK
jgi:hypothetical protein